MKIGENMLRSISGSVDKAILCVKKPHWDRAMLIDADEKTGAITGRRFDLTGSKEATVLQSALAGLAENKGGMFSLGKSVEKTVKDHGYQIFKVKYNPSKIQMSSNAGSFLQPGVGGPGTSTVSQVIMPATTYMSFEIILDEENHQDAFMFDKMNNLSTGAVVSDVSGVVKNIKDEEGYTVRPLVEALMGILTQAETREVVFFWSEMAFAGEVVSIDAQYTMFNPVGNPIRAVVKFTIKQGSKNKYKDNGEKVVENPYQDYWDHVYDKMGEGGGWQGKVGNLLNFS